MDITRIDKNFLQTGESISEDTKYYDVTKAPFSLHGIFYDEKHSRFLRMPHDIAHTVSEGVEYLNGNTAGGRIRFATDSKSITLAVRYPELFIMPHMTLRGNAGFALCMNTEKGERFIYTISPEYGDKTGFIRRLLLPAEGKDYTLHFPLYHNVDSLFIGLDKDARVGPGAPYKNVPPVLYYGSSITQGGCANRPDTSYPDLICKKNNVDFINLGFSGNALAEPQMIDYLATLDCSIAVLDYDHNAPNTEYLQKTHYAMYKNYRDKKPTTPIIFITKPNYHFDATAKARLEVIKNTYKRAKAENDNNVYFIDGRTLFGKDWDICTVDRTHPTDLGFYKMAKVIGRTVNKILNID